MNESQKFYICIQRLFLLFKIVSGESKWELFLYLLSSDLSLISENSSEVSLLSWGLNFSGVLVSLLLVCINNGGFLMPIYKCSASSRQLDEERMGNANSEDCKNGCKSFPSLYPCPWIVPSYMAWLCDLFWPMWQFKYDTIRDLGIRTYSFLLFLETLWPPATSLWISLG